MERRPARVQSLVYVGAYVPTSGQNLFALSQAKAALVAGQYLPVM